MIVLVTGASGFVGRHLVRALEQNGHVVRKSGRSHATEGWVQADLEDENVDWSSALEAIDTVVHLAALVHVLDSAARTDEASFLRTNMGGTLRLARAAQAAGVRQFVFVSTVKVHGEGQDYPYTEASPFHPSDAYARSKLAAEVMLEALAADQSMALTILRPPLIYGPGVGANFASLVRLAASGLPLPLGTAQNRRSLIYVGNLADAIVRALEQRVAGRFLIADEPSVSTGQMITAIRIALERPNRLFPFPSPILRTALKLVGMRSVSDRLLQSLELNPAPFKRASGWRSVIAFDDAIKQTIIAAEAL